MRVISRNAIEAALDEGEAMAAIAAAFRALVEDRAQMIAIGHLAFEAFGGDCHVKGGHIAGDDVFVVKVASGFYGNAARGLPSSQGFVAVMNAQTGETLAILDDGGWLTDRRTALTGVLAAKAISRRGSKVLGVVGSGTQARLQAEHIRRHLQLDEVLVWARDPQKAATLGEAVSLPVLCARADMIVTTTPSTQALIDDAWVRPGTRIIAVGADAPGKQELDPALFARSTVVADLPEQCADHGESAHAVRAGIISLDRLLSLGAVLSAPPVFADDEIVIADLTGLAVQDIAITQSVWNRLKLQ